MAATRLIALHQNKGKSISQCLKDRTEYAKNGEKTEDGKYISSYECTVDLVDKEFAASKKEYLRITGRTNQGDIIAYQIRQSFKPGEITPEEANAVGYETAMRFTKGQHAFIVATHTDRAHIHNHIIFNSTNLSCDRKFRDFWFVALALQKVSDLVCLEHALSVIKPRKPSEREKRTTYPKRETIREKIRQDIDEIIATSPDDLDEFLKRLHQRNYEIKVGKHPAIRGAGQKRFLRFDSFGEGYTLRDLQTRIEVPSKNVQVKKRKSRDFDLLIDINRKMAEGKGKGYANWAARYNVKQVAAALLFLQEHDIRDYPDLEKVTTTATEKYHATADAVKEKEKRLHEISDLRKHIIGYVKTRDVYAAYRQSGYSKKFLETHRDAIVMHKAAKKAFDDLGIRKIPKVKELNAEYERIQAEKKQLYGSYHKAKDEMIQYQIAKRNIDQILNAATENEIEQDKKQNKNQAR